MGFSFRKQIKIGKNIKANISKKGVSFSYKLGPLTMNSKGDKTLRLGKGLSYKFNKKK